MFHVNLYRLQTYSLFFGWNVGGLTVANER